MIPVSQERNMKHLRGDARGAEGPQLRQVAVGSIGGTLRWVRKASFLLCHEHRVALSHLFHPSLPFFLLPLLPLLFSRSFDQGLTQLCVCTHQ